MSETAVLIAARGEYQRGILYRACRAVSKGGWHTATMIFGVLFAGFGILMSVMTGPSINAGLAIAIGLLWCGMPWWQPWFMCRMLFNNPNYSGVAEFLFNEAGVQWSAPTFRSEMKWTAFVRWRSTDIALLLYMHQYGAVIIPNGFFASAADLDAAQTLVRKHLGEPK